MKKSNQKSNAEHLRKILTDVKGLAPHIGEEAIEFLDAIEGELQDKEDEIRKLKDQANDFEESQEEGLTSYETVELGLDTFHYKLENGNMVIEGLVEDFVESVKKKYAMLPV